MIKNVEKIEAYLEALEKEEIMDEHLEEMEEAIEHFLKEEIYSEKQILDYIFSLDFILYAELSIVERIFKQAKIIITPKDRKKGKQAYVQRLMKKYYKKNVRKVIEKAGHFMFRELIEGCKEDISEEKLDEFIEEMEFDIVYWCAVSVLEEEYWKMYLKKNYKKEYCELYLTIIQRFSTLTHRLFLEEPKEEQPIDYEKECKRYQKELIKQEKEIKKIQQELAQQIALKKEKKEEIILLKNQLEKQKEEFQEERALYAETIIALSQPVIEKTIITEQERKKWTLKGEKIAVIGGNRERWYRETIEKYQGECVYVSVDDFLLIKGAISKSEVVFFLTEIVAHDHFRVAYKYAKKQEVPFVFINSKGIATFERELLDYVKRKNEVL